MSDPSHDPVRLGLVGLGLWGTKMAEAAAISPEFRITHCFARDEAHREAFAARFGCRPAPSYQAMLEDDSIEGVLLITPNGVHYDQMMRAIDHGKHIFVDKPITINLEHGVAVALAARDAGLVIGVDQEVRRGIGIRRLKGLLDRGALGRLLMVEANVSSDTGQKTQPDEWRAQPGECPGGPLIQIGIHQVDTLHYLLGRIRRVQGWQKRQVLQIPMDDTTVTLLEFDNGMLGYLGSGYASALANWIRIYGDAAVGIYDAQGGLRLSGEPAVDLATEALALPADFTDPAPMIQEALVEFAGCIRTGAQPEVGAVEALRALAVVLGAIRSQETGSAVDIGALLREAGAPASW